MGFSLSQGMFTQHRTSLKSFDIIYDGGLILINYLRISSSFAVRFRVFGMSFFPMIRTLLSVSTILSNSFLLTLTCSFFGPVVHCWTYNHPGKFSC